jgi:serine/threonine protein kinase
MLYRLTTGKMPFTGDSTMAVLTSLAVDTPVPPRQHNPQLPEALDGVVTKLLAKNPAERFQTASAVVDAIGGIEARSNSGELPVVVAVPVQPLTVGAQTQNVWEGIEDSGSVAVSLTTSAGTWSEPDAAASPCGAGRGGRRLCFRWPWPASRCSRRAPW